MTQTLNVTAGIKGLIAALSLQDVPKDNFEGVALYAYWTTDEKEWRDFSENWVKLHHEDAKTRTGTKN